MKLKLIYDWLPTVFIITISVIYLKVKLYFLDAIIQYIIEFIKNNERYKYWICPQKQNEG